DEPRALQPTGRHPGISTIEIGRISAVVSGTPTDRPVAEQPTDRPLTSDEFNAAVAAVTNAFGDPTRREIYLYVRDESTAGVTAAAVAERFALHPNVARHHLEKLTSGGHLLLQVGPRGHAPTRR